MIAKIELGYIVGHLRYGHIKCVIPEDYKEEFLSMNKKEQEEYIISEGNIIVDDFTVDDYGDIGDVTIYE